MLRNYLIITFRNLWRHKLYGMLNIVGLATGMAVSILILLFVAHEFTYDQFHAKAPHIYRSLARLNFSGNKVQTTSMSAKFGPVIKAANPGILNFVRMREARRIVVKGDDQHRFFEPNFIFADSSLFSVFSFKLCHGNARTALARPGTVVISEAMAHKYFGEINALGKILTYDNKHTFVVTGVFQNIPSNSTIAFDFAGSFASLPAVEQAEAGGIIDDDDGIPYNQEAIGAGNYTTYFLLRPDVSATHVQATIAKVVKQSGREGGNESFLLEPLLSLHLGNNFGDFSNAKYVYVFLIISLAIMVLALVNYISLTTARATKRAKEVGVRKVLGANRGELARQFFSESVITCSLAFGLALLLVKGLQPLFYNLLHLRIDAGFLFSPVVLLTLGGLLVVCTLVAGSYPALVLSRFLPVEVLKGKFSMAQGGTWVRQTFMVFQFAVSVGLIVCSLVVQKQLDFLRNRKLGFNKEQVMVMPLDVSVGKQYAHIKNNIRQLTGISQVAAASSPLFEGYSMFFTKVPQTNEDVTLSFMQVDANFLQTLELDWQIEPTKDARLYSGQTIVINEAAARKLKITNQPIGQKLKLGQEKEIVGVLKDFNFTPLHKEVEPLFLSVVKDTVSMAGGCLFIRLDPGASLAQKITDIGKIYQQYESNIPFSYYFLDEAFNALYKAEDRLAKMFAAFTGFAIFIACLGLFGLVTFLAETRTKEIGIRKVLGATVTDITTLLSKDFLKLVLLANIIAGPAAWWAMHHWLQDFNYRIPIGWEVFAFAGLAALLIALLTISFQAIKAAVANPVKSLRSE